MLKQSPSLKLLQTSIGSILSPIPLSANQWTLLSLVLALFAGFFIAYHADLVLGLTLFGIAGALDLVDGAIAREKKQESEFGGFFDGLADRFVEFIFLFSFMFYELPTVLVDSKIWLVLLIFFGTSMPSFIRAYAEHKKAITAKMAASMGGLCERSERLLIIIVGLILGINYSMEYFVYGIITAIILSVVTIFQRLAEVKKNSK